MALNRNTDWEVIEEEMEIEANARQFARRMEWNQAFLNLFPKHMRDKIMMIEILLIYIPIIAFFLYMIFYIITH